MTGLPTLKVELESTTPGTWYDITAYVDLSSGLSNEHGRRDEESTVDASYLRLRVDNLDGRFTLGAPTYGLRVDQRIRITESKGGTTSVRHTGYVQDWPVDWLSPTGGYAKVQVVSTDRLARLARRAAPSLVQGEILADAPLAYYTLGEPAGATMVGDTSGNGAAPLVVDGVGAPVVLGEATGPVDGLTAAQFANGQYLRATPFPFTAPTAPPFTAEVFFLSTNTTSADVVLSVLTSNTTGGYLLEYLLSLDSAGNPLFQLAGLQVDPYAQSLHLCDGRTHHAAVTLTQAGAVWTLTAYVDGVSVGSSSSSSASFGNLMTVVVGGPAVPAGDAGGVSPEVGLQGAASHVAFYSTALTPTRIAAHASAGLTPDADGTDQRIARYAKFARIPTAEQSIEVGSTRSVTAPTDTGKLLDVMQQVATTEGGTVFVNGSGVLVFQGRKHRLRAATQTPAVSITAAEVDYDDVVVSADKQYLVNTVTGSRPNGATQSAIDTASVDAYEEYPASLTLLVTTDQEVLDAVQWQVNAYGQPRPRCSQVTVDLLTLPDATVAAILNLEIGDRLLITDLPPTSPVTTLDLIVEGWDETLQAGQSGAEWSMSFNTAPADLFRAWILGDPTYGVLGSTTRLYY